MYATLDEAWTRKPRVKRMTNQKIVSPQHVVLKDPWLISHFADIEDPDRYVLELISQKQSEETVEVVESFSGRKKNAPKDDLVFLLYFLVLLVLLY